MSSLLASPSPVSGPKLPEPRSRNCRAPGPPTLAPAMITAVPLAPSPGSIATPQVSQSPPEKPCDAVAPAVRVAVSVAPFSTYTSLELPTQIVAPVPPLLAQEFPGPEVGTIVDAPTLGSSGTTITPVSNSLQLPFGT